VNRKKHGKDMDNVNPEKKLTFIIEEYRIYILYYMAASWILALVLSV
jgi:hypothetical protein